MRNEHLGLLALAPLSAVAEADLPGVIGRMDQRIRQEATPEEAGILWTAIDVLMGLRYTEAVIADLLKGIHGMRDSVTYQAIVEEGVVKGRQEDIIKLGSKRFNRLDAATETALRSITDPERLERIVDRLLEASSWADLLGTP